MCADAWRRAPPDLVLDLPARAEVPAAPADSADTFAHNRDTLKKRPARRASRSEGQDARPDAPPPAPRADGSPVPARNTARVAAKFADLTLTGGSLKPALAAKPALLRRPTPHPHAPRPPPAPVEATAAAPVALPAPADASVQPRDEEPAR
ncbi:unnamed protein product [Arctia plantaginis]|uniref:Uncharacterized protein n=1 Tax=Arctia plantaginis TaxID=874455 RepID=A0A8S0Z880_ARCPL|nr:unnamed protein product [Arctia plantaginis]